MTVYLIGDSIRLASEPYTRAALPDFEIIAPSGNCRSSRKVLRHIAEWTAGAQSGDIVHINCGLHDIRHNQDCGHPVADLATYRSNLRKIFAHLKQTGAATVWASSTPFLQSVHNAVKASRRYLAELQAYNRAAEALAREFGFAVNDLYGLMFKRDLTGLLLYDGLHFNGYGSRIIGNAVAAAIRAQAAFRNP